MAKHKHDDAVEHEEPIETTMSEPAEPPKKSGHVSKDAPHHPLHDGCTVTIKAGHEKYPDQVGRLAKLVKIETDGRVVIEFHDANSHNHSFRVEDLDHVE